MKKFYYSDTSTRKKETFTYQDITNLLFAGEPPTVTCLLSLPVKISVTYKLFAVDTLPEFASKCVLGTNLLKFPFWIFNAIYENYKIQIGLWFDYLFKHMPNYCEKEPLSIITWAIFQHDPSVIKITSIEKSIWIYNNVFLEKKLDQKFILDIRESLLPWMNSKLYAELRNKQENTRINSAYEQQRQQLLDAAIKTPKSESINNLFLNDQIDIVV